VPDFSFSLNNVQNVSDHPFLHSSLFFTLDACFLSQLPYTWKVPSSLEILYFKNNLPSDSLVFLICFSWMFADVKERGSEVWSRCEGFWTDLIMALAGSQCEILDIGEGSLQHKLVLQSLLTSIEWYKYGKLAYDRPKDWFALLCFQQIMSLLWILEVVWCTIDPKDLFETNK